MSKDDFPIGMDTEGVLNQLYGFINTWKLKLFDALTSGKLPDEVCVNHGLLHKLHNPKRYTMVLLCTVFPSPKC